MASCSPAATYQAQLYAWAYASAQAQVAATATPGRLPELFGNLN